MLTFPLVLAALSAGLAGGVHCVGMCGGIASVLAKPPSSMTQASARSGLPNRRVITITAQPVEHAGVSAAAAKTASALLSYQVLLHSGRIFTYMLIGAVLGGLGTTGLLFQPYLPMQKIFFIVGNAALILLGCRLLGVLPKRHPFEGVFLKLQKLGASLLPALNTAREFPFLLGMSWGGLPCGLLYAIAPFAWFSGDVFSGAAIMLLFGLAALPHLLITQRLAKTTRHSGALRSVRLLSAALLIGIGVMGLVYFDMRNMPGFLCIT
jgi:hypothetical protein